MKSVNCLSHIVSLPQTPCYDRYWSCQTHTSLKGRSLPGWAQCLCASLAPTLSPGSSPKEPLSLLMMSTWSMPPPAASQSSREVSLKPSTFRYTTCSFCAVHACMVLHGSSYGFFSWQARVTRHVGSQSCIWSLQAACSKHCCRSNIFSTSTGLCFTVLVTDRLRSLRVGFRYRKVLVAQDLP